MQSVAVDEVVPGELQQRVESHKQMRVASIEHRPPKPIVL